MMVVLSKCSECKHAHNKTREERERDNDWTMTCDAYPNGIPFHVYKALESEPCSEAISFEPEPEE